MRSASEVLQKIKGMKKAFLAQAGQSIIEVLIATLVVGMVMVALASIMTMSVKNSSEGKFRNVATFQGQQVIEVFRRARVRDGWSTFTTEALGGTFCLEALPAATDDLSDWLDVRRGECTEGYSLAGATFTREAVVQQTSGEVVVIVTVGWLDGDQPRSVVLEQEFREYQN